jgi:alpha-tubulin suppressor-like RCC1 family protein
MKILLAIIITATFSFGCAMLEGEQTTTDSGGGGSSSGGGGSAPVVSSEPLTSVVQVSTGSEHACALLQDATVKCWGSNRYGQIGTNEGYVHLYNTSHQQTITTPRKVEGLDNVTAITTGGSHTCALQANRTIKCWGGNERGQIGDGTDLLNAEGFSTPSTVSGINTATAISAGGEHTCALLSSGRIQCWGRGTDGRLGDGVDPFNYESPTPVFVSGINTATAISAGGTHVCALLADATVKCWGSGYGNTPTTRSGLSNVVAIDAGGNRNHCALISDNTSKCWGYNSNGVLGTGTVSDSFSPTLVNTSEKYSQISTGIYNNHSCALIQESVVGGGSQVEC